MLELEVYTAGLGDLEKILELDHQLSAVPGLRYLPANVRSIL
jgi:hypothetical protein